MSLFRERLDLFHPKHWPMWAGIGFLRLITLLPWKAQRVLGGYIGRFAFLFLTERRHVVRINLGLCFPELQKRERMQLAKRHYEAVGIGAFETCMAWWARPERIPEYQFVGLEILEKFQKEGRGVILFTAHFTTLEICGRMFSDTMPMGGLYRDPDNPVVAWLMHRGRIDKMSVAVPMDDLRGLIRGLKKGHTIWYAPDQSKKGKKGAFTSVLPFFGVPARTNTAMSRIAKMSGAAVVPFFAQRLEDGGYRLEIFPELEDFPSDDEDQDAIRANHLIEENIRKVPEQYFWIHRRFKKRGEDLPDVYKK